MSTTYNIIDQAEEVMRYEFFSVRKEMNTKLDCMNCLVLFNKCSKRDSNNIYKKILKLEGEYRSYNNCWYEQKIRLNISYQSIQ